MLPALLAGTSGSHRVESRRFTRSDTLLSIELVDIPRRSIRSGFDAGADRAQLLRGNLNMILLWVHASLEELATTCHRTPRNIAGRLNSPASTQVLAAALQV
jgi:hypothetical protein